MLCNVLLLLQVQFGMDTSLFLQQQFLDHQEHSVRHCLSSVVECYTNPNPKI